MCDIDREVMPTVITVRPANFPAPSHLCSPSYLGDRQQFFLSAFHGIKTGQREKADCLTGLYLKIDFKPHDACWLSLAQFVLASFPDRTSLVRHASREGPSRPVDEVTRGRLRLRNQRIELFASTTRCGDSNLRPVLGTNGAKVTPTFLPINIGIPRQTYRCRYMMKWQDFLLVCSITKAQKSSRHGLYSGKSVRTILCFEMNVFWSKRCLQIKYFCFSTLVKKWNKFNYRLQLWSIE